jgi:transposase/tetrahydromethanopterin S-methyltransferase subunit G
MADDRRQPLQSASTRSRCEGRESGYEPHKRGLNTKIHLAVDAHGMPLRAIITAGTVADCTQAIGLIDGLTAEMLLADKGYESNAILEQAQIQGMTPVIPPKKNRRDQREYDNEIYKLQHLVENAFLWLKRWRGIATRYAKNTASFLAAVHIRCIKLWSKVIRRHYLIMDDMNDTEETLKRIERKIDCVAGILIGVFGVGIGGAVIGIKPFGEWWSESIGAIVMLFLPAYLMSLYREIS